MESVILEGNAIYTSFLRQKSSFKATKLTDILLSNGSTDLLSAKKGVNRGRQDKTF